MPRFAGSRCWSAWRYGSVVLAQYTLPAVRQSGPEPHLTTAQVKRIVAAWQAAKAQIPKRL